MGPVAMVPGYEMSEAKTRNRLQSAWILGSKIEAPKQEYFLKKSQQNKAKKMANDLEFRILPCTHSSHPIR